MNKDNILELLKEEPEDKEQKRQASLEEIEKLEWREKALRTGVDYCDQTIEWALFQEDPGGYFFPEHFWRDDIGFPRYEALYNLRDRFEREAEVCREQRLARIKSHAWMYKDNVFYEGMYADEDQE